MHSHPFSPQHEPPSLYCTPSHSRVATPSPLPRGFSHMNPSKQTMLTPTSSQIQTQTQTPTQTSELLYQSFPKTRYRLLLRDHRTTDPRIWCCAIVCLIFSILVILFGLTTLIIFLVVKPKNPEFDTNHASLNVIYFDSPGNFNGDFTFLANFSNPNRKLHVRFEYAVLQLYFDNNLIANQSIKPFSQRQKETGVVKIHFISSLVYLPLSHAMELQRQVLSNKVMYTVKGTFRVRVSFGLIHFSYRLHSQCELQMSSPPSGVLMARSCKTER
uniref:NDR1/HIN1-like protein 6 n=1 Tax=Erigeron canadensis TaxID=72917 RepID=UPI001CB92BA6|nr:NDR1/HIN1-like protein 6 [Erigeron canadensis]